MSLNRVLAHVAGRLLRSPGALAVVLLVACAAPPPAPAPAPAPLPERPLAPVSEPAFEAGIDYAVDDLLTQLRRLPAFNVPPKPDVQGTGPGAAKTAQPAAARGTIVADPAIDGNTGQQTVASKALDARLLQRASSSSRNSR